MEFELLLDPIITISDIPTLSKLSCICNLFRDKITTLGVKVLSDRFELEYVASLTLRDCYELNNMKIAYHDYEETGDHNNYVILCIDYDRIYLLCNLIKNIKSIHYIDMCKNEDGNFTEDILIAIGDCANSSTMNEIFDHIMHNISVNKTPRLLEYLIKEGYICDCSGDNHADIFNDYMSSNNVEMMKIYLQGFDKSTSFYESLEEPYAGCKSEEMYLLLKDYDINYTNISSHIERTDIYYIISNEYGNADIITDCIIKYGDKEEKSLLLYSFLSLDLPNAKILDWVGENGFCEYISLYEIIADTCWYEMCLENLCRYGSIKDKMKLLEECREMHDDHIKTVLDCIFEYGGGMNYLSRDYFDKRRGKKEVLKDLMIGIKKGVCR